jgi:hypothetical protein
VDCACLKDGDRVQFNSLPSAFQKQCSVGPNAVAVFVEAPYDHDSRDQDDSFDFENTTVVCMAGIPEGVRMNCIEIDGQRALAQAEAELVPVVATGRHQAAGWQYRAGAAFIAMLVLAIPLLR